MENTYFYMGSFKIACSSSDLKLSYKKISRFHGAVKGFSKRKSLKDTITVDFKISSNFVLLSSFMSLYREMIEELINTEIFDFSLEVISHKEYLEKENTSKKSSHHHELNEVVEDLLGYKKKFKGISVDGFEYKAFSKACKKVVSDMKLLLESDVFVLKRSDFKYFNFTLYEAQSKVVLTEIDVNHYELK